MKRSSKVVIWAMCMLMGLNACKHRPGHELASNTAIDSLVPEYSKGFRINYYSDRKEIKVYGLKDREPIAQYVIYKSGIHPQTSDGTTTSIDSAVNRVACLSTTHIGAMALLDSRKHIVSAANKDLIYDAEVRQMIEAGKITDVGHDYQPDYEALLHSRPDILFTDGENAGSSQMIGKLKSLGIHIVASRDYFEQEPLARAEWIKFFGAFIDKEQVADSIFDLVKTNYLAVKASAANQKKRPTVFCNLPYNGMWYMPCGQNYAAKIITDAGGDFLWQNEEPINGLNLTLTFEEVYGKAAHADYWINQNTLTSRAQVLGTDPKFELFDAVRKDHIYNGTKRRTSGGGMDIWETGAFLPDLVLKDLSTIFRGSGDQPMNLYYYQQLK